MMANIRLGVFLAGSAQEHGGYVDIASITSPTAAKHAEHLHHSEHEEQECHRECTGVGVFE